MICVSVSSLQLCDSGLRRARNGNNEDGEVHVYCKISCFCSIDVGDSGLIGYAV
jgi:hypothetical protein